MCEEEEEVGREVDLVEVVEMALSRLSERDIAVEV